MALDLQMMARSPTKISKTEPATQPPPNNAPTPILR